MEGPGICEGQAHLKDGYIGQTTHHHIIEKPGPGQEHQGQYHAGHEFEATSEICLQSEHTVQPHWATFLHGWNSPVTVTYRKLHKPSLKYIINSCTNSSNDEELRDDIPFYCERFQAQTVRYSSCVFFSHFKLDSIEAATAFTLRYCVLNKRTFLC